MVNFLIAGLATFFGLLILGPVLSAFCRVLGIYTASTRGNARCTCFLARSLTSSMSLACIYFG